MSDLSSPNLPQPSKTGENLPKPGADWLQSLAKASPAGIYRTDAKGACLWVNSMWSELTGRSFDSAIGERWSEAIHPEDRERLVRQWAESMARQDVFASEYRYLRPDGTVRFIISRATPQRNDRGEVVGYVGVCMDVSDLKHQESDSPTAGMQSAITARERQVAALLAAGRSNKQVAQALGISVRTAEAHRARLMRKLGVNSLAALVRYAINAGLVER